MNSWLDTSAGRRWTLWFQTKTSHSLSGERVDQLGPFFMKFSRLIAAVSGIEHSYVRRSQS